MNSFPCVVSSNYTIQVDSTWSACDFVRARMFINGGRSGVFGLFIIPSILNARSPHSFMLSHEPHRFLEPLVGFWFRFWFRIACVILSLQSLASVLLRVCVYACAGQSSFTQPAALATAHWTASSCYCLINVTANISIPGSWALQKMLANSMHPKSDNSFETLLWTIYTICFHC